MRLPGSEFALQTDAHESSRVLAGIGFMIVGVSLLPVMNTFAKSLLEAGYPYAEVNWARFTGHLVWMNVLFLPSLGLSGIYRSTYRGHQIIRSCIFFASNAAFIFALAEVSLATAACIMFMTPIFVTALSMPVLGERVGPWRWSAVLVGFLGAMVIIRPGHAGFSRSALLVFISACCFAAYQLYTRKLARLEPAGTLIVYTALVGAVLSSTFLAVTLLLYAFGLPIIQGTLPRAPRDNWHLLAFVSVGLVGGIAQLLVIQALKRGPASVISPLGYVELVSATVLGFFVFADFPDSPTWIGAALIILSGLLIAYRERLLANRQGNDTDGLQFEPSLLQAKAGARAVRIGESAAASNLEPDRWSIGLMGLGVAMLLMSVGLMLVAVWLPASP